jgi:Fe-S cluster assembly protein SufD
MAAFNAAEASLVAAFDAAPRGPAWLAEARRAALAHFEALRLPTTRHEDWRFTSLAPLAGTSFARAGEGDAAAVARLLTVPGAPPLSPAPLPRRGRGSGEGAMATPDGPRLVFVNGRLDPSRSSRGALPHGAVLSSLAAALRDVPDAVRPHLGRLARADDHAFVAANAALFEDGGFVLLPRGTDLDPPIALVFVTDAAAGPVAVHPRTLVVAEEGARATVEEVFVGRGAGLTNAVTELVLADGAHVEHVRLQLEADDAFHVGIVHAEQGARSSLAAHAFTLGGRISRSELRSRLLGEGARVAANGLYMADGARIADNFSFVEHAVPHCTTTESYKGILDGRARGVFSGRIRVLPGAQKTVAHQLSSNLLLSEDAVVDAKPQLEIFADDVKCGHGGTVGQLDAAALFYLRARGLPEAEARSLLIWAFASEMVGLVGAPALRARAKNLVASRLPAGARILEAA